MFSIFLFKMKIIHKKVLYVVLARKLLLFEKKPQIPKVVYCND